MEMQIHFTPGPIQIAPVTFSGREVGAVVEFQGVVREMEGPTALQGLHYEAYESMARKLLIRHFEELNRTCLVQSVFFVHRLGWVPVGEVSVFLRVVSSHRKEALQFVGDAIDRMKADVPIWKKAAV